MQHLQSNTILQGGKYRIERVLGQGGFGITYLATQISLNRRVAIKELFVGGIRQAINVLNGNIVTITNVANQVLFERHREVKFTIIYYGYWKLFIVEHFKLEYSWIYNYYNSKLNILLYFSFQRKIKKYIRN